MSEVGNGELLTDAASLMSLDGVRSLALFRKKRAYFVAHNLLTQFFS